MILSIFSNFRLTAYSLGVATVLPLLSGCAPVPPKPAEALKSAAGSNGELSKSEAADLIVDRYCNGRYNAFPLTYENYLLAKEFGETARKDESEYAAVYLESLEDLRRAHGLPVADETKN